jgi:4-aminobutyrate aminotransferase/(S)-3-amino-2-methylpropionate transaminase
LIERARQLERLITEPLLRLQAGDDRIGDVRGRGAMIAIELVKSGTAEPDKELAQKLSVAAAAAGVIVLTCGVYGNIIRLLPPLTIGDDLLAEGIDILGALLRDL